MAPFQEGFWDVSDALYYGCRETRSHSMLKAFRDSPLAYRDTYVTGTLASPDSKTLVAGRALHTAVLEPDKFKQMFAIKPPNANKASNANKEVLAAFEKEHGDKAHLDDKDFIWLRGAVERLKQCPEATYLLKGNKGVNERALRWVDGDTTLRLRCKADRAVVDELMIVDLKSTDDPTPEEFAKSIDNYGYHTQAAFYIDGFARVLEVEPSRIRFVIIACSKKPPYDIGIYEVGEKSLALGRKINRRHLRNLYECEQTDYWIPSYSSSITTIDVPRYAFMREEK